MLPEWFDGLKKASGKSKAVKIWIAVLVMAVIWILQGFFWFFRMFFDEAVDYLLYGKSIPPDIVLLFYLVMICFGFFVVIMLVWHNILKKMFAPRKSK